MTTLKLKINVNLPQLLCIVVSAAQIKMANFEPAQFSYHEAVV